MNRYAPYFADDTDGVHFQVVVDGRHVQAHVGRELLVRRYAVAGGAESLLAIYARHQAEIDAAVVRRARVEGPDTVVLRLADLRPS